MRQVSVWVSLGILLLYGAFFRWAFDTALLTRAGGVVSLSFIFSVPFGVGALSVAIGRWSGSDRWVKQAIVTPTIALFIGLLGSLITRIEAAICVLMAAPIAFGMTILGGLVAHILLPRNAPKNRLHLCMAISLPLIAASLESSLTWPNEIVAIQNHIDITARPETVWTQIASVPAIPEKQISNRWIYAVGFPKPIAATLDREGVGGIRTATFERDVSFFETITEWQYPKKLAFSIHADPDFIPHTAFDRHIIVGGRFYDVLDGIYEIETLSETSIRLHLTSHHRLGTRFNAYAEWWSRKIMTEIQGSILEVIKARAERT